MTYAKDGPPAGAKTDFADGAMDYGAYLGLDRLLSAQAPASDAHDEMLFIVIHQASELWMKLIIHELRAAIARIEADDLKAAFKMTARISKIQAQMIQSWDVLATLTPADYLAFRDALGHSSGFQSWQYRAIEFLLGAKDRAMIAPHRHRPERMAELERDLAGPSLYDAAIRLLARRGFAIAPAVLARDLAEPHAADPSVLAAWTAVYRDTARWWDLYELAEELVDVEDWLQVWRFRHMTTVKRVIGHKSGTGGTAGVRYLERAVGRPLFPELWDVRTAL